VSRGFPGLATLTIWAAADPLDPLDATLVGFEVGDLALPALRRLEIVGPTLTSAHVRQVIAARLPSLEHLMLCFGEAERPRATLDDLAPILAGAAHPLVTSLTLRHAPFADRLAAALPAAAITARLEHLDLTNASLTDAGAAALVASRPAFAALRTLGVDGTVVTGPAVERLRAAFAGVEVVSPW
jgi:hypothetical protein